MKHTGSCTKTCGHKLDFGHVTATTLIQQALDRDPRVVEYYGIEDGEVYEFVYSPSRTVALIYKATACQLGISELS